MGVSEGGRASVGERKVMCFKGGRGFGGQAGVRTSSNGLSRRSRRERQADGSGRDTQADRQSRALRSSSGGHGLRGCLHLVE